MWRTARCRVLIALLAALPATSAQAHHSYADFLTCESASISGKIAELQWVNPHVLVTVEDEQDVEHVLVWFSLIQAARAGVLEGTLAVGDSLVATGSPHRDPEKHILSVITAVERPTDGWRWVRSSTAQPTRCAGNAVPAVPQPQ